MKVKTKNINIIVIACIIWISIIRLFLFDLIKVSGFSMQPNYNNKDIVLISKISQDYNRFDVVVVNTTRGKMIKRIVGVPGDKLQIIDGKLYINNNKTDVVEVEMEYAGVLEHEYVVRDDEYFVLGDNRNDSCDSRYEEIGCINKKNVVGYVSGKIVNRGKGE